MLYVTNPRAAAGAGLRGVNLGRPAPRRRLGQVDPQTQAIIGTGYSAGASVATAAIAPAAVTAGLLPATLAVPLVGVAFAGIYLGIQAIMNSGCGQTCIISSQFANKAGDLIRQNGLAYFALPAPRSRTAQSAYLQNFDTFWNWLTQQCSNPQLGNAGKRCISDRQAGACTWKVPATQAGPDLPGGPGPGQCFNWFNAYRDPIAADATVPDGSQADASAAGVGGFLSGSGGLVLVGLGLVALVAVSS